MTDTTKARRAIRRPPTWIAQKGLGEVMGLGALLGSVLGALMGLVISDRQWAGYAIAEAGAVGAFAGLVLKWWCHLASRAAPQWPGPASDCDELLHRLRMHLRAQARRHWREMLDGQERLPVEFTVQSLVAPGRSFKGSIRQRSDVVAALHASASPGGGPRLLVMGEGGQGKTVALVDLEHHLSDDCHDGFGVPVRLNLGSWGEDHHTLVEWIVGELSAATGPVPGADRTVREWLAAGRIAPMLDGLDEIANPESRRRCVAAINEFLDRSPDHLAVVVTSRSSEYTSVAAGGPAMLALNGSIELRGVPRSFVVARLRSARSGEGGLLADLVQRCPTHPTSEVLRVPLWLSVACRLDRSDAESLVAVRDRDQAQRLLTDRYLHRSLTDLASRLAIRVDSCRHLVSAIAGFLTHPRSPDTVTFRLENLTPARPTQAQRRQVGLVVGLGIGPASLPLAVMFASRLIGPTIQAVVIAFSVVSAYTLLMGLVYACLGVDGEAAPVRSQLHAPVVRRMRRNLVRAVAAGFGFGPLLAIGLGVFTGARGFTVGLSVGTVSGISIAISTWLLVASAIHVLRHKMTADNIVVDGDIDEGIRASRSTIRLYGWTYGSLCALFCGSALILDTAAILMQWLPGGGRVDSTDLLQSIIQDVAAGVGGLFFGYRFGVVVGANKAGWYLLLQRRLRKRAEHEGLLPHNPRQFLWSAVDTGVLRRTGSGVQFRHRLFRDRLAERAPRPGLMDLRRSLGDDEPPTTVPNRTELQPVM